MCQIIAISAKYNEMKKIIEEYKVDFEFLLQEKGGDYFSASVVRGNSKVKAFHLNNAPNYTDVDQALGSLLNNSEIFSKDDLISIMLFSRQKPEMEIIDSFEQPYDTDQGIVAVHGTVFNDQEIASKYNKEIKVDTEVFTFLDIDSEEPQGSYAAIKLNPDGSLGYTNHGLKVWKGNLVHKQKFLGQILATTDIDYLTRPNLSSERWGVEDGPLFIAYSGGMDIALSTYHALKSYAFTEVYLNYFDWGTAASKMEIDSMEKAAQIFRKEFNIEVHTQIYPAKTYFDEYFRMNKADVKIADTNAVGSIEETESPIAYVPYRNTQFAIILASIAEEMGLKGVTFLFGLNLSEGMVFMDNSEGWIEAINAVIKYGGKDYSVTNTYKIQAPYFARTKTNMIKEFIEDYGLDKFYKILRSSYSCYYPDENGTPCGECGSCILRQKAIHNVLGD